MSAIALLDRDCEEEVTIRPLQPTIGAEIGGVDLGYPLSTRVQDEIKAALLKYKVLLFGDQDSAREQDAGFAPRFGTLRADL